MGLSDGRKSFPIGLAVLIQYRSVTASQPLQPPSHVAVAITLNAKASSLKSTVLGASLLICHDPITELVGLLWAQSLFVLTSIFQMNLG